MRTSTSLSSRSSLAAASTEPITSLIEPLQR
jgi:hypothetical protein